MSSTDSGCTARPVSNQNLIPFVSVLGLPHIPFSTDSKEIIKSLLPAAAQVRIVCSLRCVSLCSLWLSDLRVPGLPISQCHWVLRVGSDEPRGQEQDALDADDEQGLLGSVILCGCPCPRGDAHQWRVLLLRSSGPCGRIRTCWAPGRCAWCVLPAPHSACVWT